MIAALLAVLSALTPDLLTAPPLGPGPDLPWWALAAMFGAVEVCVLHVQVRREAQTVSLHEIPLLPQLNPVQLVPEFVERLQWIMFVPACVV